MLLERKITRARNRTLPPGFGKRAGVDQVTQQLSPVQFRANLKHSLAASAAGRAAFLINLSMKTSSRTRASSNTLNGNHCSGPVVTASKTKRARGCSDAAHSFAVRLPAYAP
jgi:hypothetical protein